MKNKYLITSVCVSGLLFGCVEYNHVDTHDEVRLEPYLMLGEIHECYNELRSKRTRTEQTIPDSVAFMSVGEISPEWDAYSYSGNGQIVGVDMDYQGDFAFSSVHFTNDGGYVTVELISKMLAVKDLRSGRIDLFLSLYIPDDDCIGAYLKMDANRLSNYGDKGEFTGRLFYSTLDGVPVGIDRYESGRCVERVFIPHSRMTMEECDKKCMSMMNGVILLRRERANTRVSQNNDSALLFGENGEGNKDAIWIEDLTITASRRYVTRFTYSFYFDPWLGYYEGITNPGYGGGGGGGGSGGSSNNDSDNDKTDKVPCDDELTGKTNPLVDMQTAPPSPNNPAGATYGNTRANGARFHSGVDFAAPVGTPVYAAHNGVITWPYVTEQPNRQYIGDKWIYPSGYSGDNNKAGNRLYIRFGDMEEAYWHLQAGNPVAINPRTGQVFKPGDTVYKGDIIGYTGMTGNAIELNVPHLHYGVRDSATKQWKSPTDHINTTINADYSASTPCDD